MHTEAAFAISKAVGENDSRGQETSQGLDDMIKDHSHSVL